jgi:peptidoglycan pentaglycine glycine transferase (the first glycine)
MDVRLITDPGQWNDTLRRLPYAHVLQSWEWGEFKARQTGWQPHRYAFSKNGTVVGMASIGVRRIGPLKLLYISKGPVLPYQDTAIAAEILEWLQGYARRERAIWLKIDPDIIAATGVPGEEDDSPHPVGQSMTSLLRKKGWQPGEQVQFQNTITLDLTSSEDEILAAMSQNTRRKVRTAEKKGVTIRAATLDDIPALYALYESTGTRDAFLTRPFSYYGDLWQTFMQSGLAHALIAEYEGKPIAHVILFHFGQTCWYFYGASANAERERMPNYALQWEAMKWAKAQGYSIYDFWGAPNIFTEEDRMWGVFEFKRGFRGTVTRFIGAWDYAPSGLLYRAYTELFPRVRAFMRRVRHGDSPASTSSTHTGD